MEHELTELEKILQDCKSELLRHTLQNDVVSPHIRNIALKIEAGFDVIKNANSEKWQSRGVSRSPRVHGETRSNILFFAYCMSKWDTPYINKVTGRERNQSESFMFLSDELGVKHNTFKNYRDMFDAHVKQQRSNRQGWKKELTGEFAQIIQKYDQYSEDELIEIGRNILLQNQDSNRTRNPSQGHA